MTAREILITLAISCKGDWGKIYEKISAKDTPQKNLSVGIDCITILDDNYPEVLKQAYKPPFVLFYLGDLDLLKSKNIVSVVSGRDSSIDDSIDATKLLDGADINVILGGTKNNLDKTVISVTKGKSIVVCPSGINELDEDLARLVLMKDGLILSEYPNGTDKTADGCISRNRIIEALASKTLVLNAKEKSGSLMRVTYALNYGKDVYVVPKSLDKSSGYINNTLIKEGAILCDSVEQLCA